MEIKELSRQNLEEVLQHFWQAKMRIIIKIL